MPFSRILHSLFFIPILISFTVAASSRIPEEAVLVISDTGCSCSSPSESLFDCRTFNRSLKKTGVRIIARGGRTPKLQSDLTDRVRMYLDSTGYSHPQWEKRTDGGSAVYPKKRSILIGESVKYAGIGTPDSVDTGNTLFVYPQPFSIALVSGRTAALARSFMVSGYPFVKIATGFEAAGAPESLSMVFQIDPDSLYRFDAPLLQGKFSVGRSVLLNDIILPSGKRYAVDAVERSLARLRSRRYVASADALPPLVIPDSTGDAATNRVTVPFVIADRSGMGLDGALGFEIRESEKPQLHGNLEFSFLNMFRAGEEASLAYTGDRDRQRLDIDITRPWVFGLPLILSGSGGLEIVRDEYGYLYGALTALYETAVRWRVGMKFDGNSVTGSSSDCWTDGSYAGADLVLMREHEPFTDGMFSRSLYIATGSGITRKDARYSRSHIDFSAMVHWPLPLPHQALLVQGVSGHIISREESMLAAEKYRVGGNATLRGYSEDEFAFRTVLRGQSEYLYYFQKNASLYLLCDGGIGYPDGIDRDRTYTPMLGYGIGMRLPVATGTLSVAWARNSTDRKSPGRIHVRLQNELSSSAAKGVSLSGR